MVQGRAGEKHELTESCRLGPGKGDAKEGRILNRVVRWTEAAVQRETGPKQSGKLVEQLGLAGANLAAAHGQTQTTDQLAAEGPLDISKCKISRWVAARGNYLSVDRAGVQFAANAVSRWMAKPIRGGVLALGRLGSYLEARRMVILQHP